MNEITRKANMDKIKALVATYHGAQKAKKMAESQMEEIKPVILNLVEMLGERATPSTKRVHVDGLNIDARDVEKVVALDGAVEYVLDVLPALKKRLLESHLNIKAVEALALDDKLTAEDLNNLVTTKSSTSLYVMEVKSK